MSNLHIGQDTLEVMSDAHWYNQWLFSLFKKNLEGDILEVGAGIGNFLNLLSRRGKVTMIDIRQDYFAKIRKLNKKVSVGYGDIEKGEYFFNNRKFDSLVCLNVLEHINNDQRALLNMSKLLKVGGRLILLVPAHKFLYSDFDKQLGHYRRYSKVSLEKKIRESGLKIKLGRYVNWWGAIGWLCFVKFFNLKKMPRDKVLLFDTLAKFFLWPEKFFSLPIGLSILVIAEK